MDEEVTKSDGKEVSDVSDDGAKRVTERLRENPWILSSIVLGIISLVLVVGSLSSGSITGNVISGDVAGDYLVEFLASAGYLGFEVVDVQDEDGIYLILMEYEDDLIPFYVTETGYFMGNDLVSVVPSEPVVESTSTPASGTATQQSSYSEDDLMELKAFNDCLAGKGVKIYGANWCGYTVQWVNTLGGFDIVSPIYVECTEEEELCAEEGIRGYPTTRINGQVYSDARTIEAIAQETGCPVPDVQIQANSVSQAQASC